MPGQSAVLFGGVGVVAGVVVGVAQAAQLGGSQAGFDAHLRQPGARAFCLGAERVAEQELLVQQLGLLGMPLEERHLGLRKLVAGTVGGVSAGGGGQRPLRAGGVSHGQQDIGLEFRRQGHKDAVGVALGEAAQEGGRSGFIARLVVGARSQEVGVVGQFLAGLAGLAQAGFRVGIASIQQIGVTERQIGSSRCLAGMLVRILGDPGIGRRSAQGGQLLGHGP